MMFRRILMTSAVVLLPAVALAQQGGPQIPGIFPLTARGGSAPTVPAINPQSQVGGTQQSMIDLQSIPTPPPVKVGPNEQKSLLLADKYVDAKATQALGAGGRIIFAYGETIPTVVCAPLAICDIELQAGENLVDALRLGDSIRWELAPVTSGAGSAKTIHLLVKVKTDDEVSTILHVTTDKRVYQIRLMSNGGTEWMPMVAFRYPDEEQQQAAHYEMAAKESEKAETLYTGKHILDLDFDFVSSGEAAWKPVRVYTDHEKTYIEFPDRVKHADWPSLVTLSKSSEDQVIDARTAGRVLIVDKVLQRFALVLGVGDDEERVIYEHKHGNHS